MLEDFNYFANKSINQYVNKKYNIYDINQQTTDDLRVLKATALLTPTKCSKYGSYDEIGRMMGATYEVILPQDYLHILNCICIYNVNKTYKCYNAGDVWRCAAKRLTADMYSQVLDNYWMRPTYRKPYYYIHNLNARVDGIYPPTDNRRLMNGKTDSSNNKYYIGRILPTRSNYNTLLDRTYLDGNTFIGRDESILYAIYPSSQQISFHSTGIDTSIQEIAMNTLGTYDGYKVVASVQPVIGDYNGEIYIKGVGKEYSGIEIGTDFKLGFVQNEHNNREINEQGTSTMLGTDAHGNKIIEISPNGGVPNSISITNNGTDVENISSVERAAQVRYGNPSSVRMEIRYGADDSLFRLSRVYIDYVKAPQHIRLTQEQIDLVEDTSQVLEFPDYVCQEILNELVNIIMENISDQRLQTHPVVSQSIATQQQAPEQAGQPQQ